MSRGPTSHCPHCGESFRSSRSSCPHCGSDAETGWRSDEELEAAAVDHSFTHLDEEGYSQFLESEGLAREDEPRLPVREDRVALEAGSKRDFPLTALLLLLLLAAAVVALSL